MSESRLGAKVVRGAPGLLESEVTCEDYTGHASIPVHSSSGQPSWRLGGNHSAQQWQEKMAKRGWTPKQISEAIQNGLQFPAVNHVNPGNAATRYVHPTTGRSVVLDEVTGEVIHVGGDGFVY